MEVELRDLFYQAIYDFAQAEDLTVSFPNEEFTPGALEKYLRVATLPTTPEVVTVCGESRHRWVLQISVRVRDDQGEIVPLEYADKLKSAFPVLHKFVGANHTFQVRTPPSPAPPIPMDGWFSIPVSFQVQTIT